MATKPSLVPTWNTGGANNTAPTAPKIVLGWTNGERPASSYLNHRMKLYGEWCQYLSDGAFTGNHTFGGTVGVTGAVTCSSTLGVTGAVALSSTLSVTGAVTLSSTLAITGNVTTDVTLASNKNITLQGTGTLKHGDWQENIPPLVVATTGSVAWDFSNRWWASTGSGQVTLAIPITSGKRIKSVSLMRAGNSSCNVTMDVCRFDAAGASTVLSSSDVPSATWAPQTAVTPNWTIAGEAVVVNVTFSATGGKCRQLFVTYDNP